MSKPIGQMIRKANLLAYGGLEIVATTPVDAAKLKRFILRGNTLFELVGEDRDEDRVIYQQIDPANVMLVRD